MIDMMRYTQTGTSAVVIWTSPSLCYQRMTWSFLIQTIRCGQMRVTQMQSRNKTSVRMKHNHDSRTTPAGGVQQAFRDAR